MKSLASLRWIVDRRHHNSAVQEASPEALAQELTVPAPVLQAPVRWLRYRITYAGTEPGESVYIVGSLPELGGWDPSKAVACRTSADMFPLWLSEPIQVCPPEHDEFQFKLLADGSESVRWEEFTGNHVALLPTNCANEAVFDIHCSWGVPTVFTQVQRH